MAGKFRKILRFRYSLLTLLLVVTACCVFLGVWAGPAHRQKRAFAWANYKGMALYDWEVDEDLAPITTRGGNYIRNVKPLKPNWIRDFLGEDYFHGVVVVVLHGSEVRDLSPLAGLRSLKDLSLDDSQASDLSPLVGLKHLQWLSLDNSQVSDLSPLAGLKKLKGISLEGTQVSDLSPLVNLKNLKMLNLARTQVSDLSPLAGLKLKGIFLEGTPVRDLSPLAGLKNLNALYLDDNQVSKEELEKLKTALPNLKVNP